MHVCLALVAKVQDCHIFYIELDTEASVAAGHITELTH